MYLINFTFFSHTVIYFLKKGKKKKRRNKKKVVKTINKNPTSCLDRCDWLILLRRLLGKRDVQICFRFPYASVGPPDMERHQSRLKSIYFVQNTAFFNVFVFATKKNAQFRQHCFAAPAARILAVLVRIKRR